jgi:vacuolar protein sorting-associated protein 35
MLFHRTIFYIFLNYLQGACVKKLSGKPKLEDIRAKKQIVALLSAPLEKYNDIVTALTLSNYPHVMDCLDYETNKGMAMVIIQSAMKNNTCISTADKVKYPYIFIQISHIILCKYGNLCCYSLFRLRCCLN